MERQARSAEHTVSEDGVTVQQYYTKREFELPSVVFEIATERAESVEIRFVVTDIEARRVGFHPRFRSEAWAISDGQLVFEATVGPDETVTTVYALDTDEKELFERAIESLRIEQVAAASQGGLSLDPNAGDTVATERNEGSTAPADDPTPVGEPATGDHLADAGRATSPGDEPAATDKPTPVEGSGSAGTETTAGDGGGPDQSQGARGIDREETSEQARGTNIGVTKTETAGWGSSSRTDGEESTVEDTDTGGGEQFTEQSADALVEELLERLDRGELPPAARERLVEQVTREQSGADEARLASLQTRMSDIEAFSGPVEQLLDEHGPPAAVLDAFDERLTALEGLDERVSELETQAETIEEHENRIERLGEQVTALGDELDTTTAQLETDVAAVETQLESLRAELERVEDSAETARERASDPEELDESLAELEARLDGVERRLDGVTGDWKSVEADIAALREWRSNLANTFGAVDE